jgi:membrane protease YdiL (CAAX protease family)
MSGPEFELPSVSPPVPPPRWGWIVLLSIVAFLILAQLGAYLNRRPSSERRFTREDLTFRMAVLSNESRALTPTSAPGPAARDGKPEATAPDPLKDLVELRRSLRNLRLVDPYAALLDLAMAAELKEQMDPAPLKTLGKSTQDSYRAAAEVYGSETLTKERAKELANTLRGAGFAWTMARIHALEKAGDASARRSEFPASRVLLYGLVGMGALLAVPLGGIVLLLYAAGLKAGRIKPRGLPSGALSSDRADAFAMRGAQLLLLFIGVGVLVDWAFGERVDDATKSFIVGGALLWLGLALFSIPVGGRIISLRQIGLFKAGAVRSLLAGFAGAVANAPLILLSFGLTLLLQQVLPQAEHPLTVELAKATSPWSLPMYLAAAAVFAPFFEEITFRGVLFPALTSALGKPVWGVLASSLIFAAIHPTGIPAWPGLAVIGATAAVLTYQTGSLWPAIVMHSAHNAALLIMQKALT